MMLKTKGFTLIELMIVVVIVALLAAVAIPSYQDHIRTSRRADAQGALLGYAQAMERLYTEQGSYNSPKNPSTAGSEVFPTTSPSDGGTVAYNLALSNLAATTYTITATPTGPQAGDGIMTINHLGEKRHDKDNDGNTDEAGERCWSKTNKTC